VCQLSASPHQATPPALAFLLYGSSSGIIRVYYFKCVAFTPALRHVHKYISFLSSGDDWMEEQSFPLRVVNYCGGAACCVIQVTRWQRCVCDDCDNETPPHAGRQPQ
jgi:hypothetical protein